MSPAKIRTAFMAACTAMVGQAGELKPGMPAPAFKALDQEGRTVSLDQFRGRRVVLYFYPKDDTPGCTAQACSLRDGHGAIEQAGAVVIGVSADDVASHKAFAAKYSLPFTLLADPDRTIIEAYGVKMPVLGMARRVTFVINAEGRVGAVISSVDTRSHDRQVLESLKSLR